METGIGKLTDAEIARTMRHAVGSDGRCIMPFMPFAGMSDEDLTALISYLRSQEPVKNPLKKTEFSFLVKAVMAFGMIKPEGAKESPPKSVPMEPTVAYGNYLANHVANCVGCHTLRDMKTGALIGIPYAGGMEMAPDEFTQGYGFITPNLTPDPETGVMAAWDEETFISRFKLGRGNSHSPMPWGAFSRINDMELKAIYLYLKSLEPVKNKIPKTIFNPGEEMVSR
jgi:mono/diheme cytochrome c family protein